ncbi:EAL domain-containing response regulator [Thermomonas fusca]|nr:EAL domain-containing response regulator [Thermomonas fusca]
MKILIVDDDPFLPRLLDIQLRNLRLKDRGFTGVTSLDRVRPAIELLANADHDVGLLFCDLVMPEIDGIEFLRHLSDIGFRGGVVLLSGAGAATLKTAFAVGKAYGLNMVAYAEKPVPPDVLTHLLQAYRGDAAPSPMIDADDIRRVLAMHQARILYQPIIDVASDRPAGFEALARLPVPGGRLALPNEFLPAMRADGLAQLDWQVLLHVASDLPAIRGLVGEAFVSVNVSAALAGTTDFPERLSELLVTAGVPAAALRIEIQEADLGPSPNATLLANLARLAMQGVGLAIDRFGSGGRDSAALGSTPFDEVKIRIGAHTGTSDSVAEQEGFNAMATRATNQRLRCTAVAVESPEQWQACTQRGCSRAQGFLISPGLPIAELGHWLADWAQRPSPATAAGP